MKIEPKVNALEAFVKHYFAPKTEYGSHFPMNYEPMTFKVRHSGDPLLAALNITPRKGSLDFGESSKKTMHSGLIFLVISIGLFVLDCYCICNLNNEINREKQGFAPARAARYRTEMVDEEEIEDRSST